MENLNRKIGGFLLLICIGILTQSQKMPETDRDLELTSDHRTEMICDVIGGALIDDQTICYGETPATITSTIEAYLNPLQCLVPPTPPAVFYQWQKKTTGSWTNISGATGLDFSPGALTETTQYRRAATIWSLTGYTNTITITVNPNLQGGHVSQPAPNPLDPCCSIVIANFISASGGDGDIVYQWEQGMTANGPWISLLFKNSHTLYTGVLSGTQYYRRKATSCGQVKYSNVVSD